MERMIGELMDAPGVLGVVEAVLSRVERAGATSAAIYPPPPSTGRLRRLGARGLPPAVDEATLSLPPGRGLVCRCLHEDRESHGTGEPLDPEGWPADARAWPLGSPGAPAGCLVVLGLDGPAPLSAAERDLAGRALARALAADRVKLQSDLFTALLPLLEDGVLAVDTAGGLHAYGPALARMTGWSATDVAERGWTNLVYETPEERAAVHAAIAALLRGRASQGTVRSLARADGTHLDAAIWSVVVPDPAGGPPVLAGVLRDVSEAESVRRAELRQERLAQLGRFAGGIAHDLNNILGAVLGHAELAALLLSQPDRARRHVDVAAESARRGGELVARLLAFAGATHTRLRPTDVAREVQDTVDLLRLSGAPLPTIELAVAPQLPLAEADRTQLHQVVLNVVKNACDAAGVRGRVEIVVARAPLPEVAAFPDAGAAEPGQEMILVEVRDSGVGFSADALANLYEPFFTTKREGHGLGLPAVRGILRAHGGGLSAGNEDGAVVRCFLPVSTRPEAVHESSLQGVGSPGVRIWLVEDDPLVSEYSEVSLAARGHRVRCFDSGEALRAAAARGRVEDRPELLIMDGLVGEVRGRTLLDAVRAEGIAAEVLWISGFAPDDLGVGVHEPFLQKPFAGSDLVRAVDRVLADRADRGRETR